MSNRGSQQIIREGGGLGPPDSPSGYGTMVVAYLLV